MKAIRKSDGKVIEVKEWRGSSDVIYSDLDMNAFYQASDLDFSVGVANEAEGEVISGWVAREESGDLFVYRAKPIRNIYTKRWKGECSDIDIHNNLLFPSLTWDSEPMEVEITIKPKKKSSTK